MYKKTTAVLLFLAAYLPVQIALSPTGTIDLASGRVIILFLIMLYAIEALMERKIIVPLTMQTFLITSFLCINALSLITTENPEWGLRKLLFLCSMIPLYFVVHAVITTQSRQKILIKALLLGATVASFFALSMYSAQFIFGKEVIQKIWSDNLASLFLGKAFSTAVVSNPSWYVHVGGSDVLRAFMPFPDPHMLAFYIGLTLPWAVALFLHEKKKRWIIVSLLLLITDIFTFSRGGYIGLLSGGFFSLWIFRKEIVYRYKKLILAFFFISIILLSLPQSPIRERLVSSFDVTEGSNYGRIETWKQALNVIGTNPVLGVGLGNYALSINPDADYRDPIYAHSLYLDIASESGIFNALIWVTLLISGFVLFYKKAQTDPLMYAGSVSIVIFAAHSLVETPLFSVSVFPLFLIILALSGVDIKNEAEQKKETIELECKSELQKL